jgi:putative SOS response-associated peptidase YedK
MCGRYALHANPEVVALQFGLEAPPEFKASYNICPGGEILVVTAQGARRRRWGFGNKIANARGESIQERPAFRDAFRQWRCLVPASGFYEWQTIAGRKHPWYFKPKDAELFALAGITAIWKGIRSVSLITTAPNEIMQPVHDRMPVIVKPEDYAAWLAAPHPELLAPYPAERMSAWPVSPRVSRPENDDPALIEEAPPAQGRLI